MFNPHLTIGQVLTEKEVHSTFECQTTFGIRMSKKNNLFVIMSGSAKKKIYDDVWEGDTLYYNGTDINSGSESSQTLEKGKGNNNSQLRQVWFEPEVTRPQIFLFVKHESNKCIFKGEVTLKKEPYMASRHDDPSRKVWIFPLQLKKLDRDKNQEDFEKAAKIAYDIELDELYNKVKGKAADKQHSEVTKKHESTTTCYERNPEIATYAKRRAHGLCDLCNEFAPFQDMDGKPYLEAHHIIWLAKGGADEIENVVALCPNCHKKMHIVAEPADVESLKQKIDYYKAKGR